MDNITQYRVYENQSWLDISNILYGTSAHAYRLAQENKSSITENVKAGTLINYPLDLPSNKLVLLSMASYKSNPATAVILPPEEERLEGIGYWVIQTDFKVS